MSQIIRRRFPIFLPFLVLFSLLMFNTLNAQFFKKRTPQSAILQKAKRYDLVEFQSAVPGSYVDMRYKVTSASGKPLYLKDMPCLVNKATAQKLNKVQKILKKQGYALKVWDAWRPPEAHKALWDAVQDPKYVVPPSKGLSLHCYGVAVDLSIVKADGTPLKVPSKFDEFNSNAASNYVGGDPDIERNLGALQAAMKAAGFRIIKSEWWHFDDLPTLRAGVKRVTAADLGIKMP